MMTKMRSSRLTQLKVLLVFPLMMLILLAFANPNAVVKSMNVLDAFKDTVKTNTVAPPPPSQTSSLHFAPDHGVYPTFEKGPEYRGGNDSLMLFLNRNINCTNISKNAKGVLIQFTVNEQGDVKDAIVKLSTGSDCDKEALRVIKLTKWKPAEKDGKKVSASIEIPVNSLLRVRQPTDMDGSNDDTPHTFVEIMPQFPGGTDSLMHYLGKSIRYPSIAKEMGIQGKVVAQFVIEKTGKVSNIKIIRALGGGCDEEAIRVIKTMPDWKPGYHNGNPVSVYFTLPINFALEGDHPKENEVIRVPDEDAPLTFVEQMPEFPGGMDAMMKYLGSNIKYPSVAQKMGLSGKVVVQFIVDKQGKISKLKIIRALGGGCDEEAVRVVNSMPAWKPGKQKGKTVPVYFTLPIFFQLK